LGAVLVATPLIASCSADDAGSPGPEIIGVKGVDATVSFEHAGTLTLVPGETAELSAVGKPAAPYAMTFLLTGDSLDASLDRTDVIADENGRATVTLRAPNTSTYFAVRVELDEGPSATLNVAVSDQGFGTLSISPDYDGNRDTREWVASVVTGTDCEALEESFPMDPEGPTPVTGEPGTPIVIEDIPVGPNLAVFLRGGHYMWGCADVTDLVAGEVLDVGVPIADAPLDLAGAELELVLDIEPNDQQWPTFIADQRAALVDAFLGGQTQDAMLVDAMAELYTGDAQEYATASASWDVAGHFSGAGVDLGASIAAFVDDGMTTEPLEITALVSGVDNAPDHAVLTLLTLGSATPEDMHIPAEYVTSFTADPNDTVRLGGTLFWMPSRYFGHVAAQSGLAQHPTQTTFAEVLSEVAACDSLVLPGLSQCMDSCVVDLCAAALEARWETALASSAAALSWGELPFESSGASRFDDSAVVTGFSGTWLGELSASQQTVKVTGAAEADDANSAPD
jgi:hypothetical protein